MKDIKIIIHIEGGIVQAVHSTHDIQYIVVDEDDQSNESLIVGEVNEADSVIGDKKFSNTVYKKDSLDPYEKRISKQLKQKGF